MPAVLGHCIEYGVLFTAEKNNGQTRNFQKLLYHCSLRVKGAGNQGGALRAANAITSVRVVIKHLTESLNASQLLTFLDLPLNVPANGAAGHHGVPHALYALVAVLGVAQCDCC